MQKRLPASSTSLGILSGAVCLFILYLTSRYNYLLFHSIAEIFSIVVACGIFMVAWNSRRLMDYSYFLMLGIAYLFVGGMDTLHTLAYTGMGVFPKANTNLPTQLWIASRYVESLSLLLATVLIRRTLKPMSLFSSYAIVLSLVLGSIFYWNIFPDCFIEGEGLTTFKKVSEYAICIFLAATVFALSRRRKEFDSTIFRLLVGSIVVTIFSELAFTFYVHAYDFSNLVGHFLKIISFYLIYRAVIETGLVRPFNLIFRDLKLREEALNESERRYAHAEKIGHLGYWERDFVEDRVVCSDETCRILGFDQNCRDSPYGSFLRLVHPDDKKPLESASETALSSGEPLDIEYRILRGDGKERVVHLVAEPRYDASGNPAKLVGAVQDVTEHGLWVQTIQDQNEFFETVMDSLDHPFYVIDAQSYEIDLANSAVGPGGHSHGITCYALTHGRDKPCEGTIHPCPIERVKKTKQPIVTEHIHYIGDNNPRHVEIHAYPIMDGKGDVFRVIEYTLDVTDRKRAEEALKESEARYRLLSENLDREVKKKMAELQQAQSMAAIGRMVSTVAHEVRNPLQNIQFGVDAMRKVIGQDKGQLEIMEGINYGVTLLNEIIAELLDYSKPLRLRYSTVPLQDVVKRSLMTLDHNLSKIDTRLELANGEEEISVDAARFGSVLVNIITNAAEAMPDGGTMTINSRFFEEKGSRFVRLSIIDTGCGIEEENLERVYEPFFTTKSRGIGLGIPACAKIIAAHKGDLHIASKVKEGTAVEITVPVANV